ncbi:GNAT family N-acetyltransferase [Streptomyces sp. NPDC008317]|uniref:GNAT family N-acetyltransferase n=1 Tax=Streptomyces sp. NPDC008317 TaxID=3364827 RepID=UPI0036ED65C7
MSTSLQHPQQQPQNPGPTGDQVFPASPHPLDNPAWAALTGAHRHLAQVVGSAARYPEDVSPFVALADPADPAAWADLAALMGPGATFALAGVPATPDGWRSEWGAEGVQLVGTDALLDEADPEARPLGPADVPEMLDLVERTKPGPFRQRTIELGAYYGIRRDGKLVAMAGERLRLDGWTEISAVCTDDAFRGQGLASRLVRHTAAGIRGRGDRPFLHAAGSNVNAIRLYESIGFALRRTTHFRGVRVPGGDGDAEGTGGAGE